MGQVLTGATGQNPARQATMKSGVPKRKPAFISSIKFVDLDKICELLDIKVYLQMTQKS